MGLGGVVTFNGFDIAPFNFKASIQGAPWTVGVASVTGVQTANGAATTTVTAQGFAHGPMSASTTANISGVVQLVTPTRVTFTNLGNLTGDHALFTTMRLHFIPEPGQLLLLGCGAAALLVVGGFSRARTARPAAVRAGRAPRRRRHVPRIVAGRRGG